jgi:hypothetical protein
MTFKEYMRMSEDRGLDNPINIWFNTSRIGRAIMFVSGLFVVPAAVMFPLKPSKDQCPSKPDRLVGATCSTSTASP